MGYRQNDLVNDATREAIQREHRRRFLETAAMQRHGWIENIGDLTDADLERMAPRAPTSPE